MGDRSPFEEYCIVSCGMLQPELSYLMRTGFLSPRAIAFTPPGLHAIPDRLEKHLTKRLEEAKVICPPRRIIVAYGRKCYLNPDDPSKNIDSIIRSVGEGIRRVQADYCYDMLAGREERERISGGEPDKILWFTPGWLENWKLIYQRYLGWDKADANANFPGFYRKIIVLDGIGISRRYIEEQPEKVLELFDWTGVEVEFREISLDRLKKLLLGCL